jgi:hypothetical protein
MNLSQWRLSWTSRLFLWQQDGCWYNLMRFKFHTTADDESILGDSDTGAGSSDINHDGAARCGARSLVNVPVI